MIQITLNIGCEQRADGIPLTEREQAEGIRAIEAEALRTFGGFTLQKTMGAWRAPSGDVATEAGISLEVLTDLSDGASLRESAKQLARVARDAMRQQCVLLRVREVEAEFV